MVCENCGNQIPAGSSYCSFCGVRVAGSAPAPAPSHTPASSAPSPEYAPPRADLASAELGAFQNTSGQGASAQVPAEIDRWNWGAFLLNWIWGLGNNTFIALLMFLPLLNMVMPFVLGFKGSAWAWRNKRWESIEAFRRTQRLWALWGLGMFAAFIVFIVLLVAIAVASLKSSDAYQLGAARVQASAQAQSILGAPVTTGFPSGNIQVNGPNGKADMSFSATGSKAKGKVYVDAVKIQGKWVFNKIELEVDGNPERIDLNRDGNPAPAFGTPPER